MDPQIDADLRLIMQIVKAAHPEIGNYVLYAPFPNGFDYSVKLDNNTRTVVTVEALEDFRDMGKLEDSRIEQIYNEIKPIGNK